MGALLPCGKKSRPGAQTVTIMLIIRLAQALALLRSRQSSHPISVTAGSRLLVESGNSAHQTVP